MTSINTHSHFICGKFIDANKQFIALNPTQEIFLCDIPLSIGNGYRNIII